MQILSAMDPEMFTGPMHPEISVFDCFSTNFRRNQAVCRGMVGLLKYSVV